MQTDKHKAPTLIIQRDFCNQTQLKLQLHLHLHIQNYTFNSTRLQPQE